MTASKSNLIPCLLVAAVSAAAMQQLHMESDRLIAGHVAEQGYSTNLIPDSNTVKMYALGFDRVMADLYWLAFIQYYGDVSMRLAKQDPEAIKDGFRQAPAFLRLVIELDPHFIQPYWFSSFVIGSELNLKKEAEELLDLGISLNLPTTVHENLHKERPPEGSVKAKIASIVDQNHPAPYDSKNNWVIPYIAGFNQFWYSEARKALKGRQPLAVALQLEASPAKTLESYQQTEKRAAEYYRLAAGMPGAPPWLQRQANILQAGIRSRVDAIRVCKQALAEAKDPIIIEKTKYMLMELWSRVFWDAPADATGVKQTALQELQELGLRGPIPKHRLPALDPQEKPHQFTQKDLQEAQQ